VDRLKYTHMENATKIPGLVCKARLVWLAVVVIFAVHTLGLGRIHKPVEGIWNADPIVEKDWCLHFHHLQSQAEFWQTDGRLWGYNPYFMAGYPSNTIQDLSIKFFQALAVLTPGNERVRVFKLLVFLFTAALPWMAFVAGRNFFWDTPARQLIALTFALLGTACWWNSLAREMYFYGMVGFQVTCYFALLTTSVFYRLLTDRSRSKRNGVFWIICITMLPSLNLGFAGAPEIMYQGYPGGDWNGGLSLRRSQLALAGAFPGTSGEQYHGAAHCRANESSGAFLQRRSLDFF
jgi:hypothetical protein